jgi:hypothetical protein
MGLSGSWGRVYIDNVAMRMDQNPVKKLSYILLIIYIYSNFPLLGFGASAVLLILNNGNNID